MSRDLQIGEYVQQIHIKITVIAFNIGTNLHVNAFHWHSVRKDVAFTVSDLIQKKCVDNASLSKN